VSDAVFARSHEPRNPVPVPAQFLRIQKKTDKAKRQRQFDRSHPARITRPSWPQRLGRHISPRRPRSPCLARYSSKPLVARSYKLIQQLGEVSVAPAWIGAGLGSTGAAAKWLVLSARYSPHVLKFANNVPILAMTLPSCFLALPRRSTNSIGREQGIA